MQEEAQQDRGSRLLSYISDVVQDAPMAIAVFDRHMILREHNRTFARLVAECGAGVREDEVIPGVHARDVVPSADEWVPAIMERVLDGETVRVDGQPIESASRVSYWDMVFAPVLEDGRITGMVELSTDATERVTSLRGLEERVAERTEEVERRRQVAEGLHQILKILNSCCPSEEVLDFIILEAGRLLDCEAVGIYRVDISDGSLRMQTSYGIADDRVRELVIPVRGEGYVASTIARGKPMVIPDSGVLRETAAHEMPPEQQELLGSILDTYGAVLAVPIVTSDQLYGAMAMYFHQPRPFSTEDVVLAADLADHLALALENAELRERAEMIAVSEERSRLARDLHDAVTQTLFSASLIAEVLPALWEKDAEEGRRRLQELRRLARGALAEMRTLLLELRPSVLVEADLTDLLRQLAEVVAAGGMSVDVRIEGAPGPLPPDVQIALYRIAQEALNNVVRHARAKQAIVSLVRTDGLVRLRVGDDGCGFDTRIDQGAEHLGQRTMRERAEAIGAAFTVSSSGAEGTCVQVDWRESEAPR